MFILLKISPYNEQPTEDQISELLINTDNVNHLTSMPGSGVAIVFNSPVFGSNESPNNMLIVNSSLNEIMKILKEKGLM